jgi:hypothetical protein
VRVTAVRDLVGGGIAVLREKAEPCELTTNGVRLTKEDAFKLGLGYFFAPIFEYKPASARQTIEAALAAADIPAVIVIGKQTAQLDISAFDLIPTADEAALAARFETFTGREIEGVTMELLKYRKKIEMDVHMTDELQRGDEVRLKSDRECKLPEIARARLRIVLERNVDETGDGLAAAGGGAA